MNFKHYLAAGAITISLVVVSQFMGGYAVNEAQTERHAAIIVAEIERIFGHSIGKSEGGRLVEPSGVWFTARLPAYGYGPDTYSDLGEIVKLSGWSTLLDKRQAYCRNGTTTALRSAENIGEKSSIVVVGFEFGSLSLSWCGKSKDGNKSR